MRFIWLLAFFLPGLTFADTTTGDFPMLFDVAVNDLSISYLKILFGQVGSVLLGPPNSLVQQIFTIFNLGIMTLAGVLMCYTVVLSVVNTSQEGNPMGHKMSPWVVVRIVAGSAFMMPMSTGYALIQVITMWMVIQGIGFADMLWAKAVDVIAASPTGVYPASANENNPYQDISDSDLLQGYEASSDHIIANLFGSSLCLETYYQIAKNNQTDQDPVSRSDYYISVGTDSNEGDTNKCNYLNNICFNVNGDGGIKCGKYKVPALDDDQDQYLAMSAAYSAALTINSYVQSIFSDALTDLANGTELTVLAKKLACIGGDFIPQPGTSQAVQYYEGCTQSTVLDGIASTYLGALGESAYKTSDDSSSDDSATSPDWAQETKEFGWLSAGTYYTSISASNSGTISSPQPEFNNSLLYTINTKVAYEYSDENDPQNIYQIFDNYTYDSASSEFKAGNKKAEAQFSFLNSYYMTYAKNNMSNMADEMGKNTITVDDSGCSFSSESAMTYTLDNSINQLRKNWLQWGGSQNDGADDCEDATVPYDWCSKNSDNPFRSLKLYNRSALSFAATDGTIMYVGVPQRSLFVLLNRSLSELLGLKYFDDFAYNATAEFGDTYGDQGDFPKGGHSDWSGVSTFAEACSAGLIDTGGHGLYGQVLASMRGDGYEPLGQMRFMGLHLMKYGVEYFSETIAKLIDTYTRVGMAYWGLSLAFAAVGSAVTVGVIMAAAFEMVPTSAPAGTASLFQLLSNTFNSGMNLLYQTDQVMIGLWQSLSAAMAVTYAILGFIMGVYMANVPAIIFVFAAISFFMYVIEAMIASVLVALGLTHPEGHDLLGKAEQSIMLFLAAFIRPAAMIMGLIFSMLLMIPAFRLLNFTFIGFIGEYFDFFDQTGGFSGSIVPLIGGIGVAFLYAYLSMGIINNCFSLIYQVPDRLLRWLGAPTEPSMIQQMVNEVKGSVSEAAKSAGGGAESAAGSAKVSASANISPVQDYSDKKGAKEDNQNDANVNNPGD